MGPGWGGGLRPPAPSAAMPGVLSRMCLNEAPPLGPKRFRPFTFSWAGCRCRRSAILLGVNPLSTSSAALRQPPTALTQVAHAAPTQPPTALTQVAHAAPTQPPTAPTQVARARWGPARRPSAADTRYTCTHDTTHGATNLFYCAGQARPMPQHPNRRRWSSARSRRHPGRAHETCLRAEQQCTTC